MGSSQPKPKTYVYIDGFNLYYGCFKSPTRHGWSQYKWLDLGKFCDRPGTDYEDVAVVEAYDARMRQLRDVEAENRTILELLKLGPEDDALEIGTGTGAFAVAAARVCRRVHACDISEAMLAYATRRAQREGVDNIEFRLGGFLTCEHPGEPVAAVVTQLALHHQGGAFAQYLCLRR